MPNTIATKTTNAPNTGIKVTSPSTSNPSSRTQTGWASALLRRSVASPAAAAGQLACAPLYRHSARRRLQVRGIVWGSRQSRGILNQLSHPVRNVYQTLMARNVRGVQAEPYFARLVVQGTQQGQ
jgi:hypothetical protein